ncbi:MAG: cation transporter [Clostridia bacterium]|nr:cation transporter [Clostridia bacterium]
MKGEKGILVAFLLNLIFSAFEFAGGVLSGSVAILSDSVHDLGDAVSIGAAWLLERKRSCPPDEKHTYGYTRYSMLGGFITSTILLVGSAVMITSAVNKLIHPSEVKPSVMTVFGIIGVCVNMIGVLFTRGGHSLNRRAVRLHMLEDVLGWVTVIVGAAVIRLTGLSLVDPVISIFISVFILISAIGNLKEICDIFLEKTPHGVDVTSIRHELCRLDGVADVHHIHVRRLDEEQLCATMHIVSDGDGARVKSAVRETLRGHGISHATLELETRDEPCGEVSCKLEPKARHHHHNHGHSH